jgi:adhesin/invasin
MFKCKILFFSFFVLSFHFAQAANQIVIAAGDGQSQMVTATLGTAPQVFVTTDGSTPVSGATVTWAVKSGGGKITATTSTTDGSGFASVGWTMGMTAGTNTLRASLDATTGVTLSATATAANVAVSSGDGQVQGVTTPLADPLVVYVTTPDGAGSPVANVTIDWKILSGAGTLSATTSVTDANGLAQVSFKLGALAGANSVKATIHGLTNSNVTFNETALTASISDSLGGGQSGTVMMPLSDPLQVMVTDSNGSPVENALIDWTVGKTGGVLDHTNSFTDSSGIAQNLLTLGKFSQVQARSVPRRA